MEREYGVNGVFVRRGNIRAAILFCILKKFMARTFLLITNETLAG
jgi:hypothetical protein